MINSEALLIGITVVTSILAIFLCWLYLKLVIDSLKASKKLPPYDTFLSAVALIPFAIGVVSIFAGVIRVFSTGSSTAIENILLRITICFVIASAVFSIQIVQLKKTK